MSSPRERGSITIVERRPPWSELIGPDWTSMRIAQLRYDPRDRSWSLYACDRNERWFPYVDVEAAPDVAPLLAEIGDDPDRNLLGLTAPRCVAGQGATIRRLGK